MPSRHVREGWPTRCGALAAAERFRKRLALAFFCHLRKGKELFVRRDLDLPGLAWERARIEELAGRAQSWLDGD
jgi:hypothetical protein